MTAGILTISRIWDNRQVPGTAYFLPQTRNGGSGFARGAKSKLPPALTRLPCQIDAGAAGAANSAMINAKGGAVPSVLILKFARVRYQGQCEFQNRKDTSNLLIPGVVLISKFAQSAIS